MRHNLKRFLIYGSANIRLNASGYAFYPVASQYLLNRSAIMKKLYINFLTFKGFIFYI